MTDRRYEDILRERIFEPAGMKDSGYNSTLEADYRNAGYLDMNLPYAAGSLYSTVEDLYKWDQALYGV